MIRVRGLVRCALLMGIAAIADLGLVSARAADRDWIDANGGIFSDPFNWENSLPPGAGDRAVFNLDDAYTVSFTTNPTNSRLRVADDTVTFNLLTHTYTLTSAALTSLSVGGGGALPQSGVGNLRVRSGTLNSVGTSIGSGGVVFGFGSGRLEISTGALWNNSGVVTVGDQAPGTLEVNAGADATAFSAVVGYEAAGSATITGAGSLWSISSSLDVGGSATGTLSVLAGGKVTSDLGTLGTAAGATGTVTVSGANSRWELGDDFFIGGNGTGTLNVNAGGFVYVDFNTDSRIADAVGSSGVLNVTGGTFNNQGTLAVGQFGGATVHVGAGGTAYTRGNVLLGASAFATATVLVSGASASFNSSAGMYVGGGLSTGAGTASMTIEPGASVNCSAMRIWPPGTVHLAGGHLSLTQLVLSGGVFDWTAGTLSYANNLSVHSGGLFGPSLTILTDQRLETFDVIVGQSGHGDLTLAPGGELSCTGLRLADAPGVVGSLHVDGSGAFLSLGTAPTIGVSGRGELAISAGGVFETFPDGNQNQAFLADAAESEAQVIIDGFGSEWTVGGFPNVGFLQVGYGGEASIEVRNGGLLRSNYGGAVLGVLPDGVGTVVVRDDNSLWLVDTYEIFVGREGTGRLEVRDGAIVDVDFFGVPGMVAVGDLGIGDVLVDGMGSLLRASLVVGNAGAGTLTVQNGGVVESGSVLTALFPGASSALTIDGTGSALTVLDSMGLLIIGSGEEATMSVTGGGLAHCVESFLGDGLNTLGTATINGAGSEFRAEVEIIVGFFGEGRLIVTSGGRARAPLIEVSEISMTGGDGLLTGEVINYGLAAPGMSAGQLTVEGDYAQQTDGAILIELGGTLAGEFDVLNVTGTAHLDGTLEVALINGFTPQVGQNFTIITAGLVDGAFADMVGADDFLVKYNAMSVTLISCHLALPGDYDCSGGVGLEDYFSFAECLGGPGVPYADPDCARADIDADGDVDLEDFGGLSGVFSSN